MSIPDSKLRDEMALLDSMIQVAAPGWPYDAHHENDQLYKAMERRMQIYKELARRRAASEPSQPIKS